MTNRILIGVLVVVLAWGVWFFTFSEETPTVVWATADIAGCSYTEDAEVAAMFSSSNDPILVPGDVAYPEGSTADFNDCFDPDWGAAKGRIYPSPGNHEYLTEGAAGYFEYFGERAGDPDKGYYSFDAGNWHVLSLNSNCSEGDFCEEDSEQLQWVEEDLAANSTSCTIAFMHHPLFDSSKRQGTSNVKPIWDVLYANHVDLMLNGHAHFYERFDLQDPDGNLDPENGIQEFIIGTGGKSLYPFTDVMENSVFQNGEVHGALKLELYKEKYLWSFVTTTGDVIDSGEANCR